MEKDLIINSFRNCVSASKCKGCEWHVCKLIQSNPKAHIPIDLALAVLSLIYEQEKELERFEPMKPVERYHNDFRCANCGREVTRQDIFCGRCGQAVNWNA